MCPSRYESLKPAEVKLMWITHAGSRNPFMLVVKGQKLVAVRDRSWIAKECSVSFVLFVLSCPD